MITPALPQVGDRQWGAKLNSAILALVGAINGLAAIQVVTGTESRPVGVSVVLWVGGTTKPTNMAEGDLWLTTS